MNFINFEAVKFRMGSYSPTAASTECVSKVVSGSCEPDACLLSSSSSSRSCDLRATPSQKHWSMQDMEKYVKIIVFPQLPEYFKIYNLV